MARLCILCNRLYIMTVNCPQCGKELQDLGLIQDFYDPYSAYEDQRLYQDGYRNYTEENCVHLLSCSFCGFSKYTSIKRLMDPFTDISLEDHDLHC